MPINKVPGEKKNGLQKYRIRVNYVDSHGKYRQKERTAYGMEDAKALERQLLAQVEAGEAASAVTVGRLCEEYLKAKRFETRESTWEKTRRQLRLYVLPAMEHQRLDKLSPRLLQAWKSDIEERGLAIKTRKNIYSEFRALLNYAVKMEYLPRNPLLIVGNFKDASTPQKEMRYYTAEQFRQFIAAAPTVTLEDWHFYVFFCIAFYTGMRKGEIYALRWTDIRAGRIYITRSIGQKVRGEDRETPPKNRSSIRDIQIPAPLLCVLEAHKERCRSIEGFTEELRICGALRPIRDATLSRRNIEIAHAAGLEPIRIHDFRHSHASLLANNGVNIQEISRRLGHANIEETWNTYAHLYPREEEKAVSILNTVALIPEKSPNAKKSGDFNKSPDE